jgi:hypothetical protein
LRQSLVAMAGLLSQESGSDSGWAASYKSEVCLPRLRRKWMVCCGVWIDSSAVETLCMR